MSMVCCYTCKHARVYPATRWEPEDIECHNEDRAAETPDGSDCYGFDAREYEPADIDDDIGGD